MTDLAYFALTISLSGVWFIFGIRLGRDFEIERQQRQHAERNVCFPLPTGPPFPLPQPREPYPGGRS